MLCCQQREKLVAQHFRFFYGKESIYTSHPGSCFMWT